MKRRLFLTGFLGSLAATATFVATASPAAAEPAPLSGAGVPEAEWAQYRRRVWVRSPVLFRRRALVFQRPVGTYRYRVRPRRRS